ncbi:MAG: class I SAM-dependent methyltransferase [Actinomycetota bacterium]
MRSSSDVMDVATSVVRVDQGTEYARLLDALVPRVHPNSEELRRWSADYLRAHRHRFLEDLAIADEYTPAPFEILELGSIPPLMTAALRKTGRSIIGVDIDPGRFSRCIDELELDVRRCDLETERLPFDDGSFDAVMMNEVFEHLRIDPIATMTEVVRVLKPAGRLLLSTPNLASYRGYVNLVRRGHAWAIDADPYAEYTKLRTLGHMGHVREYTPREVGEFLDACGLRPTTLIYRGVARTPKERLAVALRRSLLPFFSIIAEKPR